MFKYKGKSTDEDFSNLDNAFGLIDKIRNGEISLNEAKDEQTKLRSDMGEIKRVQEKAFIKRE